MKVRVKVYGTLQDLFPGYPKERGLKIELPAEATFGDLIRRLGIPESNGSFAIANSKVVKRNEEIKNHSEIRIMQPLNGG